MDTVEKAVIVLTVIVLLQWAAITGIYLRPVAAQNPGGIAYWLCDPPFNNILCATQGSANIPVIRTFSATFGTCSNSSSTFVACQNGVTVTTTRTVNVTVTGELDGFASGATGRLNYELVYSTTRIPNSGQPLNAGDAVLGNVAVIDVATTTTSFTLPLVGFKSGVTGTFYVYVAFGTGNGAPTNNLHAGSLNVQVNG